MRGIDWAAIETKRATPLFLPDSKKANFDATHELEELLLEDNPLKAKKRDPKKNDINSMSSVSGVCGTVEEPADDVCN